MSADLPSPRDLMMTSCSSWSSSSLVHIGFESGSASRITSPAASGQGAAAATGGAAVVWAGTAAVGEGGADSEGGEFELNWRTGDVF